jgi:tetratricopeptide (TPR) repeat protein
MSINYDRSPIKDFITEKIGLNAFCDYLYDKFEQIRGIKLNEITYEHLPKNVNIEKIDQVIHIVEKIDKKKGYFADFVIHLINFWFEKVKGNKKEVKDISLREDLCLAAQELWGEEEQDPGIKKKLRKLAQQGFNRLAELDSAFAAEWKEIGNGAALEQVEKLEPHRNIKDFSTFLKDRREHYQKAQKHIKDHHLVDAREMFFLLDNRLHGYSDVSAWVKLLENETVVRKLQTLIDIRKSGFVYDDRLPWPTGYPYRLFQQLGSPISPNTPMKEVKEEFQRLKKQESGISEESLYILETLVESEVGRLFVDAFYHPVIPAEKTLLAITEEFFNTGKLPTPQVLATRYPEEAAILLFLLGYPGEAEKTWKKDHIEQPLEGISAHCLGLFYLGNAYDNANTDPGKRVSDWQAAIAHWAVALTNTAYWVKWGRERFNRYDIDFVFAHINEFKSKIKSFLGSLLEPDRDKDSQIAGNTKGLQWDMEIEFQAIHLTQAVGGVDIGEGCAAWFGPLWMRAYERQDALANHISAASPPASHFLPAQGSVQENFMRLRRYFSYLSKPAVLLEGINPNPGETLQLLYQPGLPKEPDCGDPQCPVHGEPKFPLQVHCRSWDGFEPANPAYKALAEPMTRMCEDALHLAITAHWIQSKQYIDEDKLIHPELVEEQWKALLKIARYSQNPADVRQWLRRNVLAETAALPKDMAALDAAIKIIELCLSTLSASYNDLPKDVKDVELEKDKELKKQLAQLLAHRGMKKLEIEDIPAAEENLSQALSLAPHIHSIRIKLVELLMGKSASMIRRDLFQSQEFLRQANAFIKTGQEYKGFDYSYLLEQIARIRQTFSTHKTGTDNDNGKKQVGTEPIKQKQPPLPETSDIAKKYARGIKELREKRPDAALSTFEQAFNETPEDIEIQKIIPTALMEYALQLCDQDFHDKALELVNHWLHRLPSQENQLKKQLEFLKKWPELLTCLNDSKDLNYNLYEYREVHLFPLNPHTTRELQFIKVLVEDNCLSFDSLLPPIPDTEKAVAMLNLLQASNEIMFKLVYSEKSQLAFKWAVPFRLVTPGWFNQTALDLFHFSNITVEQILDKEKIGSQFREIEARSNQRHPTEHLSQSAKILEKVCRERQLRCDDLAGGDYKVNDSKIKIKIQKNGTRFYHLLGAAQQRTDMQTKYMEMVRFNTENHPYKLSLDKDMNIIYSVLLPHLDEESTSAAFTLLENQPPELAAIIKDNTRPS